MEKRTTKILPAVLMLALAAVLIVCPAAETDADIQKLPPVIKDDMSADDGFKLTKDTVIEESGSLTLSGSMDLDGKTLTVRGKLVMNEGALLTNGGTPGGVVLEGRGFADLQGTVGNGNDVRFGSAAGEVMLCQVGGLFLSVFNSTDNETLMVTGTPSSVSDNAVFRTSGVIFGDLVMNDLKDRWSDSNTVVLDGKVTDGSTLHITSDTVTAVKTLKLLSGSELVIEGTIHSAAGKDVRGYIELKTGSKADIRDFSEYVTDNGFDRSDVPVFVSQTGVEDSIYGLTYSSVSLINLPGILLESVVKETSDGKKQQLAITAVSSKVPPGLSVQPEMVFTGTVTVPEGVQVEFPGEVRLTSASGGLVEVEGMMKLENPIKSFKGSQYMDGRTYCYTDFDTAFGSGAMDITLRGGHVFDGDCTLPEGMRLYFDQELVEKDRPRYVIPEGCTFTVSAGSAVGPDNNFTDIDGTLKVSVDGNCIPASEAYEDSWMTDGYRVYSGTPEPEGTSVFTYLAIAVVLVGGLLLGVAVFRRSH